MIVISDPVSIIPETAISSIMTDIATSTFSYFDLIISSNYSCTSSFGGMALYCLFPRTFSLRILLLALTGQIIRTVTDIRSILIVSCFRYWFPSSSILPLTSLFMALLNDIDHLCVGKDDLLA